MTYGDSLRKKKLAEFEARNKRNPFDSGMGMPPPETLSLWERLQELLGKSGQPPSDMLQYQPPPETPPETFPTTDEDYLSPEWFARKKQGGEKLGAMTEEQIGTAGGEAIGRQFQPTVPLEEYNVNLRSKFRKTIDQMSADYEQYKQDFGDKAMRPEDWAEYQKGKYWRPEDEQAFANFYEMFAPTNVDIAMFGAPLLKKGVQAGVAGAKAGIKAGARELAPLAREALAGEAGAVGKGIPKEIPPVGKIAPEGKLPIPETPKVGEVPVTGEVKPIISETPKVEAPKTETPSPLKGEPVGGEPPIVPPKGKVTPFGAPETPLNIPPVYKKSREMIAQSQEMVRQDRPGTISRLLQRIPGVKQAREFERPAFKMTGENEKLLVGHVAETAARSDVATRQFATRLPLIRQIEDIFGKEALQGGKTTVPFVGTSEQASNILTGTLKDIADNPELYTLSKAQKTVLASMETRNAESLKYVTEGYGAEIGRFMPKEGGAYLPNVDIAEDVVQYLGSETRTVATGRGKTRIWQTARDRMASDKTFVPETDVRKMLEGTDTFKASAAAGNTFREAIGGMTRMEVMEKTHPNLYKKMSALKGRLQSLKGSVGTLDENLTKGVDNFLNSSGEVMDIIDLSDSLKLKGGIRKGLAKSDIQKEIESIKGQIDNLRPAWEAANLKPYTLVQEGIFRYFPYDQAKIVTELRKTSNNGLLNLIDNVRATAFSGDLSPVLGVQTPMGILADPLGSFMVGKGGVKKMAQAGDVLRPFRIDALSADVAADPDRWAKFFSLMGRAPAGTPKEFAAGWLGKIPGFNKATEATYTFVTRQQFALWDRTTQRLIKSGLPELEAQVVAASKAAEIYPLVSPSRLGQSQARANLLRALPTSYSFIRQPANMIAEASRGFVKIGLKKTLTPREKLSVQLMTTMAASTLSVAAISQVATAAFKGEDVKKAFIDAINPDPYNGNFASLVVGDKRVPIGGPYRAIFRAIFPQEVTGIPFPVPFAGVMRYLQNRINPLVSTQIDLVRNKDYYGKQILKGKFPEQLLRGIAYEVEGILPLTLGSGVEGIRTGNETKDTLEQMAGQFAGTSLAPAKPDVERINKAMGKVLPKLGQPDIETLQKKLEKALTPERKAEITKQGSIFNIGDLGEAIDSATQNKKLADMPVGRYSPIVYARKNADEQIEKFYNSIPTNQRDMYRQENPTLDAMLFFWGKTDAVETGQAMQIVRQMMADYGVPASAIPGLNKKPSTTLPSLGGLSPASRSRLSIMPASRADTSRSRLAVMPR